MMTVVSTDHFDLVKYLIPPALCALLGSGNWIILYLGGYGKYKYSNIQRKEDKQTPPTIV